MKNILTISIGSDIIEILTGINFPLKMVDQVYNFDPQKRKLESIKFISSNEPVFQGHFPGLKLWPGVYTIEGLRQSIIILRTLQFLNEQDLVNEVILLQKNKRNLSRAVQYNDSKILSFLKEYFPSKRYLTNTRVKLIAPVYSESIMKYEVSQSSIDDLNFNVTAFVNDRIVATGSIGFREKKESK